jgi:hypothetical protein
MREDPQGLGRPDPEPPTLAAIGADMQAQYEDLQWALSQMETESDSKVRNYWATGPVDGAAKGMAWKCRDHWPTIRAALERLSKLEELAKELAGFAIDAAYQGAGQKPLSSPSWHSFISTWEEADDLFRRADFRELLSPELRAWLEPATEEGSGDG